MRAIPRQRRPSEPPDPQRRSPPSRGFCAPACPSRYGCLPLSQRYWRPPGRSSSPTGPALRTFGRTPCRRYSNSSRSPSFSSATGGRAAATRPRPYGCSPPRSALSRCTQHRASGRAGLVYGAASAITLILWFVKLRDDYRHFQRHTGQVTKPRPKFGALWLVAPRLSARAWVVAARRSVSTVDESVAYAEVWRAVYEDSRKARVRRGLARRTAWRSVAEVSGGVWADLPRTAEVAAVNVVQRGGVPGMAAVSPAWVQA
jgi:hypothetical protein